MATRPRTRALPALREQTTAQLRTTPRGRAYLARLQATYNRVVGGEKRYLHRQHISTKQADAVNAVAPGSQSTLAALWIRNGGPPAQAATAAAVAMAESGGRMNATDHDSNGSTDYGLWQINSVHGYNSQRLLSDADYNAQAAVAVWKSSGWGAWTTYTSGAYRQFLGTNSKYTVSKYGGSRPGGSGQSAPNSSTSVSDQLGKYVSLRDRPRTAPPKTKNPFQWWWASFTDGWDNMNS